MSFRNRPKLSGFFLSVTAVLLLSLHVNGQEPPTDVPDLPADAEMIDEQSVYDVELISGFFWFPQESTSSEFRFSNFDETTFLNEGDMEVDLFLQAGTDTLQGKRIELSFGAFSIWFGTADSELNSIYTGGVGFANYLFGRAIEVGELQGRYGLFGSLVPNPPADPAEPTPGDGEPQEPPSTEPDPGSQEPPPTDAENPAVPVETPPSDPGTGDTPVVNQPIG